jgi:hypothetical protein
MTADDAPASGEGAQGTKAASLIHAELTPGSQVTCRRAHSIT